MTEPSASVMLPEDPDCVFFVLGYMNVTGRAPDIAGPLVLADAQTLANNQAMANGVNYLVLRGYTNHRPSTTVDVLTLPGA